MRSRQGFAPVTALQKTAGDRASPLRAAILGEFIAKEADEIAMAAEYVSFGRSAGYAREIVSAWAV